MVKTLEALTHLAGQLDGIVRNELDPHTATRVHGRHARGRNNA